MSDTARKASIEVTYQGTDITKDVTNSLISFSANDNAAYNADDISIILEDRSLKWLKEWWPERGDILKVKLKTENWFKKGSQALDLGAFLLDEPSYSSPPSQITLSGISTPADGNFSETARDKAWKKVDIKTIAQEISGRYGLKLIFDSKINPIIERKDQNKTADMVFLNDLCKKYGLAFKVTDSTIAIFDFSVYEAKTPTKTIDRTGGMVKSFTIQTGTGYTACQVTSSNSNNKTLKYKFQDPSKKGQKEKLLEKSEDVRSQAEAQIVAKAALREANKEEIRVSLTIVGDPDITAAMTIKLKNFGKIDGDYFIDKINYTVGPYEMKMDLYRVMGW